MDNNIFSKRLKEAREKAGLKQSELAKKSGVTSATISAYENSDGNKGKNPSLDNAMKLANALGVSLDWLCGLAVTKDSIQISDFVKMLVKLSEEIDITIDSADFADTDVQKMLPNAFDSIHNEYYSEFNIARQSACEFATFHYDLGMVCFSHYLIDNFLREWQKIRVLHDTGTIDDNLYNLWLNQQYQEMDKKQERDRKQYEHLISVGVDKDISDNSNSDSGSDCSDSSGDNSKDGV